VVVAPEQPTTGSPTTEQPAIADSVLDLIGHTPLVRLNRVAGDGAAEILGKFEVFNPAGSVKDRIARAMVEAAEAAGTLQPGATLVEPTSGNTGIGLAMVCATKGYRLVLTMPEDMSLERRRLLERFGAQLVLTPAIEGMTGAVHAAQELVREKQYVMLGQFDNPANPEVHRRTTGPEIIAATGGQLDAFVAGVGTGGTITGVGEAFREAGVQARIVAVEPQRAPVLQGGRAGIHGIQGIGASFVPGVLNREIYGEVMGVRDEDAFEMTKRLTREEGLLVGVSSGANVWAAVKVARELGAGKRVVTMLCDTGERYLTVSL
jgi:cysteine synthase